MSLRSENFAGIVWPNDPIGPDGGGSLVAPPGPAFGDACCAPVPVVASEALPVEGCFDTGAINAARALSGVGMPETSLDCDLGCCLPLSSAVAGTAIDHTMSVAARTGPARHKHLCFMEAPVG